MREKEWIRETRKTNENRHINDSKSLQRTCSHDRMSRSSPRCVLMQLSYG